MAEEEIKEELSDIIRWYYDLIESSRNEPEVKECAHTVVLMLLVEPIASKLGNQWGDFPYEAQTFDLGLSSVEMTYLIATLRLGRLIFIDEVECIKGVSDNDSILCEELQDRFIEALANIANTDLEDYKTIRKSLLKVFV